MPDLDERVAVLESRVQEQAVHMADLRGVGAEVRQEIRALRDEMSQRFEHMEGRFEHVEGRFERVERRFEHVGRRFDWLIGIVVTGFIAVIGTVAGAFWGLLQTVRSAAP